MFNYHLIHKDELQHLKDRANNALLDWGTHKQLFEQKLQLIGVISDLLHVIDKRTNPSSDKNKKGFMGEEEMVEVLKVADKWVQLYSHELIPYGVPL